MDEYRGHKNSKCKSPMIPIGLAWKKNMEISLVHMCKNCKKLDVNRIAGDDNTAMLEGVYQTSLRLSPEVARIMEDQGIQLILQDEYPALRATLYGKDRTLEDYYKQFKSGLEGIALDIDDTICATQVFWAKYLLEEFGNPEGISPEELVRKYSYVNKVPYFGKQENQWVEADIACNETKLSLPVVEGAGEIVREIDKIIPIACYISTRPTRVTSGTNAWLRKSGFPDAPSFLMPDRIRLQGWGVKNGMEWKARVLECLYPNIIGILDDNSELLRFLDSGYKGKVFLVPSSGIDYKSLKDIKDYLR